MYNFCIKKPFIFLTVVAQHQIVNIQSQLNGMSAGHQFELKDILSKLLQLQEKLEKTCLLVEENQQKISDLQAALAQIGDSMTSVEDDMARLKESNKLWKNNFVIVNRTFTQLRNSGCLWPSSTNHIL